MYCYSREAGPRRPDTGYKTISQTDKYPGIQLHNQPEAAFTPSKSAC
jgi:hypothetical protein